MPGPFTRCHALPDAACVPNTGLAAALTLVDAQVLHWRFSQLGGLRSVAVRAYLGSVPEPTVHLKADHAPEAVHLLDRNGVVGVAPQPGVVHLPDVWMAF